MMSMSLSNDAFGNPSWYAFEHTLSTRLDTLMALCLAGTCAAMDVVSRDAVSRVGTRLSPFSKSISKLASSSSRSGVGAINVVSIVL